MAKGSVAIYLLTAMAAVVNGFPGELKFDENGNLLDDGLTAQLANPSPGLSEAENMPSGSKVQSEKDMESSFDDRSASSSSGKGMKKVITIPESDKVKGDALVRTAPNKSPAAVPAAAPPQQMAKAAPVEGADTNDPPQYQYMVYQQNAGKDYAHSEAEDDDEEAEDDDEEEEDDDDDNKIHEKSQNKKKNKHFRLGASRDEGDEMIDAGFNMHTKDLPIAEPEKCHDADKEACSAFQPFCNIMGNIGFKKCRKTCGLCAGESIVYTAKFPYMGHVSLQQFYMGQPVYLTACFKKSKIDKMMMGPKAGLVIHNIRSLAPRTVCGHAGSHWNPFGSFHGDPHGHTSYHRGDLGNIKFGMKVPKLWHKNAERCADDESAYYSVFHDWCLYTHSPEGLLAVLHNHEDDGGKNFLDLKSRTTGNLGGGWTSTCGIFKLFTPPEAPIFIDTNDVMDVEPRDEDGDDVTQKPSKMKKKTKRTRKSSSKVEK